MDGWMDKWMDKWMNGWMDGWMEKGNQEGEKKREKVNTKEREKNIYLGIISLYSLHKGCPHHGPLGRYVAAAQHDDRLRRGLHRHAHRVGDRRGRREVALVQAQSKNRFI